MWSHSVLEQPLTPPAIQRLEDIDVPILIIFGHRDVPVIHAIVEILEKGIPHVEEVVIPGAGHLVNMEKPDDFNHTVTKFFEKHQ